VDESTKNISVLIWNNSNNPLEISRGDSIGHLAIKLSQQSCMMRPKDIFPPLPPPPPPTSRSSALLSLS
jgi:hypothetical protein